MSLDAARTSLESVDTVARAMSAGLARVVEKDGRLSRSRLDAVQPEAFELARTLGEVTAARALLDFVTPGTRDAQLAKVYVAEVVRRVTDRVRYGGAWGDIDTSGLDAAAAFVAAVHSTDALAALGRQLVEGDGEATGDRGFGDDHAAMRETFARFGQEQIAPLAESIHREDRILPEALLSSLADLGVFGISIPEDYGGFFVDNLTMCIATEELSRASLGAGGSVITRPEIAAKALLKGGTEAQKQEWLPKIAAGETLVSIAVTEPNAGSDVARLRVTAKPVEGGWRIDGEKTWCTFAGRANVFALLARTGTTDEGAKGLTLFLVEKPATISETDHHSFHHEQPGGGTIEGHAIPTIGYRGMHSFTVTFDGWFVPDSHRVGALGQGFALQMEGFAGGRIQTAARAVGVMETAFDAAVAYARERTVFGTPLSNYSINAAKLARMAATIFAARRLTYDVAAMLDEGRGHMEASLVKLTSCRDAEWVTREAMQLHGGMGYSEEYPVSRYWQDARVLSIFEGAEEILAIYVVARQHLRGLIG